MGRLRKKFSGDTAEASSDPMSSGKRTPNSLKPKPKISRNILSKGALQVQEKKGKKEKSALGNKKKGINNGKEDDNNRSGREMTQKSTTGGVHDKKNQENVKIKEKGDGLVGIKHGQISEGTHGQLESQQNEKNKEKLGDLQGKQLVAKDKEKWFKKIEPCQINEEKNGHMESQRKEKSKEKLGGLQKKQLVDKDKGKWFKKTETGQMNEVKHGQLESHQNEKKKEVLGGLIFMCSAKTKPDCFRYSLMGITMNKKELVLGIKPGLKLFLYDFDLKLLYGIYEASSAGGVKLEPAAFGGNFPVQVRFTVQQDCYPLPESVFKRAIKDNYSGEKKFFNTELTVQQVKKLMELFRPAEVRPHAPPIGPTPMLAMHNTEVNDGARESLAHQHHALGRHLTLGEVPSTEGEDISKNYFPSEREYRTYGLRAGRQNFTPPRSQIAPSLEPHLGHERQHLLMHPGSLYAGPAPAQGEAICHDPHSVTEKHNQTYGLFPRRELWSSTPLATTAVASSVDSYLKIPYSTQHYVGSYLDPYRPPSGQEELPLGSYSVSGRGEMHHPYLTESSHLGRRENVDAGMLYSTYASSALSEYNQINERRGAGPEASLVPVSSRYSFAGPSLSHR